MTDGYYHTIESIAASDFRDRGSRFLAFAFPVLAPEDFKVRLAEKKKEHPKAAHHCFAYRIGFTGDQFRVNDDGEPSGSAGRPILGQLDSRGLTQTAVIVVRYFGGTLLGIPGLIHAYGTAASLALESCAIIKKPVTASYELRFDYRSLNEIMRICKQYDVDILFRDMGLFCLFRISIPVSVIPPVLEKFQELNGLEINKSV